MRLPIRLRLTLAFACGMALVIAALGAFIYLRLGAELLSGIDMGLRSRAQVLAAGVADAGAFPEGTPGHLIDADEAFAQVLDPSRQPPIVESSPRIADTPLVPAARLDAIRYPTFLSLSVPALEDPARLLVVPIPSGDGRVFVVVGATLSDRGEALDRLLVALAIGGPILLVLTSLAGWWLAGAALRPVERLRGQAEAISVSEPGRRLAVPETDDELARLATTLNAMLERLERNLEQERRFVDDAAHELRTPLTVLKGELDLALSRPRAPDELERALRSASAEADRLARLAEDLLVLSRATGGRLPVHRTEVVPADVVAPSVETHRRTAVEANVRLEMHVPEGTVNLDPVRIRQAVDNLLDNAIEHTPAGGVVLVTAERSDGRFRLSVQDPGPGFPAGFLQRAFEPFARRDGNEGGAGLGLAIVSAVAEGHGGTATARNLPEGGAVVTLDLPV
jgi:heavy metal sensor kinase